MSLFVPPPPRGIKFVENTGHDTFVVTEQWFKWFNDLVRYINVSGGPGGAVPSTRQIGTIYPITGGGYLTSDLNLRLASYSSSTSPIGDTMYASKILNIPPISLTTTTTTNLLNCNITSLAGPVGFTMTQPYIIIRHIRLINRSASGATVSLWKGATGANVAGTEFCFNATTVDANTCLDVFPANARLDAADFLVGGASANNAITMDVEAEICLS